MPSVWAGAGCARAAARPAGPENGLLAEGPIRGSAALKLEAKVARSRSLARTSGAIFATSVVESTWAVVGEASATSEQLPGDIRKSCQKASTSASSAQRGHPQHPTG